MKLEVNDVLYDSSSSISSNDSTSPTTTTSQSSRNNDFLATIGNGTTTTSSSAAATSYAEPLNLVSSLDGLHSGVQTRTTPTLTPTTLRTIEQTFLEFTTESSATHNNGREAGFVPPLIEPSQPTPAQTHNGSTIHEQHQQRQQQQPQHPSQHNNSALLQQQQQQQTTQSPPQPQQTRRNMGGRRPTRTIGMSPEEEERRQVRRERNKMAAARCRKRRLDHTNTLLEETEGLEQKKQSLQDEIHQLTQAKDELEFMLEAHRSVCRRLHSSSPPDIKPIIPEILESASALPVPASEPQQQQQQQQQQQSTEEQFSELACPKTSREDNNLGHRPSRPNSLPVRFEPATNTTTTTSQQQQQRPSCLPIFTEPKPRPSSLQFKTVETPSFMKTAPEVAGIPITTPSSGIPFNFDSLMEGGTGLTPVSTPLIPSCSSQQRSNGLIVGGGLHHHHNNSHHIHNQHGHAVDLSSPDANPPKLVSL